MIKDAKHVIFVRSLLRMADLTHLETVERGGINHFEYHVIKFGPPVYLGGARARRRAKRIVARMNLATAQPTCQAANNMMRFVFGWLPRSGA